MAHLQSIAEESRKAAENGEYFYQSWCSMSTVDAKSFSPVPDYSPDTADKPPLKRKAQESGDNDSGGYNSDDEGKAVDDKTPSVPADANQGGKKGKKKRLDDMKREERNAREKERSFRISRQINDLRNLLSSGGVIVPKGTKSSVLTEAANYIRMLQQHQYRSEM